MRVAVPAIGRLEYLYVGSVDVESDLAWYRPRCPL